MTVYRVTDCLQLERNENISAEKVTKTAGNSTEIKVIKIENIAGIIIGGDTVIRIGGVTGSVVISGPAIGIGVAIIAVISSIVAGGAGRIDDFA